MDVLDRTAQIIAEDYGLSPTEEVSREFYVAYAHFNAALFDGELPECLITMQRRKGSRGYFAGERFGHREDEETILDEIALNPATFIGRTDREIISTLVHEMAHLWQHHFGKPGRGRYHNKQWAAKMDELGLTPSHTGEPGGKRTGERVSHYIVEGGPYARAWDALPGFRLDYQDRISGRPPAPGKVKCKYVCEGCDIHVWGKSDLQILCVACSLPMR
jgi:hypothetical protein